ncbi:MAG: 2-hydroxyglutaryl-CoA dehydratase [Coriobacteriales bacterium]|nr:2-hydroxyglutaryl-CoA dehydratase [Coriobacteriales bacterium]
MADLLTLGMDVGSTTSKCLILRNGEEVLASALVPAGTGTSGPSRALEEALASAGLAREDVAVLTATGYGRSTFPGADYVVSELSCHALGAHALCEEARTVIDIGGQDAKALRIGPDGKLESFLMNDKCAAGTGRFLEVMARVLEKDVSDLAEMDEQAEGIVPISSTCTVFAESEVISQLAKGVDLCSLVKGIHASVAVRTAALARRLGVVPPIAMTGGVARNAGVVHALESELGTSIRVSPLAQMAGALGAAIYGYRKGSESA